MKLYRRGRTIMIGLGLILLASACGPGDSGSADQADGSAATADEGSGEPIELVLYQSLSPEEIIPIVEGFELYYSEATGREVDIASFHQPGSELQATMNLEAEGDAMQADIMISSSAEMQSLQSEHELFAPLETDTMADSAIPDSMREAARESGFIPTGLQPYIIAYNTELVAPEEVPESWADLLDERWQGQIGMGDPETTSGAHIPLWFITEYLEGELGSPYGWEYYERLGELNPTTASSHDAIMELINAGELQIGILGYGTAATSAASGNPVAAVLPEEGVSAIPVSTAVVADSDELEAAEAFAEWIVSQEGQAAMYEGARFLPIRSDVEIEEPPFPFEPDPSQIVPLDAEWVAEEREENVEMFRQTIG